MATRCVAGLRVALIALVAALSPVAGTVAAAPITWGGEFALHSDFSVNESGFGERRVFPLSASAAGLVRWRPLDRLALMGGVGYDQRVKTTHGVLSFDLGGGSTFSFEAIGQLRERSIVLPLALELAVGAWNVAPGVEWRHVGSANTRIKWSKLTTDGETTEFPGEPWGSPFDPPVRDRWSATIAIARAWRGDAGTRTIGLRWAHGLTDLWIEPDVEEYRRSLELVLGWSH